MNASHSLSSPETLSATPRRSSLSRFVGVVAAVAVAATSAFAFTSHVRAEEDARQAQLAALDHEARNAETEIDLARARINAIDAQLREVNAAPVALPTPPPPVVPIVHEPVRSVRPVPSRVVSRPTPPRIEIDPEAGPDPLALDDIPSA